MKTFDSEALVVMKLPEWVEELNQRKVIPRRHKNKWGHIKKEIQVTERNMLLKFLQMIEDLPKIDLGVPASRGDRLVVSRSAVEAQLRKKRKVVMVWWQWSYTEEEIYSNHWIKLPFLQQNQSKLNEEMSRVKPHGRTAFGWLVVGKIPVLFILMKLL